MQGFMMLANIGTEKNTQYFTRRKLLTDGWMDGRTES